MPNIPFQDLELTNSADMEAYVKAATDVLRSGRYINGREVSRFERALALTCNAPFAVAVSTGLDALRLILLGYIRLGRLKPGDEVIVPANTFIATFLAVTSCGLVAVAADVREDDFCLDFSRLPLSEKTRAIITVHLYGNPCWNREVLEDAHERGILVIEDDAQAIGAEAHEPGLYGSRLTGVLGDAAAISFYPAKNVGAFGDAGAVITHDPRLSRTVRMLANYGSEEKYRHTLCGFNCRMDEIQAALLGVKLRKLDDISAARRKKAELYDRLITNPEVKKPRIFADRRQVWHQYVVRHHRRDALRKALLEAGIGTEIHYPIPCHLQECYSGSDMIRVPETPIAAERLAREILSLPIADATEEEIRYISDSVNAFS